MALAAHHRTGLLFDMAAFAIHVKRLHQAGSSSFRLEPVTVLTALILRGLPLHELAILVKMMAFTALFQLRLFVMIVVGKYGWWPANIFKPTVVNLDHVFLGMDGR